MTTFDFRPPAGWTSLETEAHGVVLERVASDKGKENPRILIRTLPMPSSVDEIPGITPSELRAQGFDQIEVGRQEWHSPEAASPYINQLMRAERTSPSGQYEELGVGAIHIIMSDVTDPSRKQLLSFQLRFHRDDDAEAVMKEFGEVVASTTVEG